MPCSGNESYTYTGPSWEERKQLENLYKRVAMLEAAMCAACRMLEESTDKEWPLELAAWFEYHKKSEGCQANKEKTGSKT